MARFMAIVPLVRNIRNRAGAASAQSAKHADGAVQVWEKADASLMDKCLAPDVELIQPVLGHVFRDLDTCKNLVEKHYAKVQGQMLLDCRLCVSSCRSPQNRAEHEMSHSIACRCSHDRVLQALLAAERNYALQKTAECSI